MLSSQQNLWIQSFDSWTGNSWPGSSFSAGSWPQTVDSAPLSQIPMQNGKQVAKASKNLKPTRDAASEDKGGKSKFPDQPVPPSYSPESFYILPAQTSFEPANDTAWKQYFVSPSELLPQTPTKPIPQQYNNSWSSPPSPANQSPSASPPASPAKVLQKQVTPARSKRNLDIETELSKQNLYKTELCRSWMETGVCPYGSKCQFAHGREELRPVKRHPKYKTEICRTFHTTGTCPYGKRCRFIHDPAERSVSPSLTQIEADALELDIQRQLAALRLSLQAEGNEVASPEAPPQQPQHSSSAVSPSQFTSDEENAEEEDDCESDEEYPASPSSAPSPPHISIDDSSSTPTRLNFAPKQKKYSTSRRTNCGQ